MGICKLCLTEQKLINAHIIPEAFFKDLSNGGQDLKIYSSKGFPKKSPIGVYDDTILCKECDNKFSVCDQYAIEFFRRDLRKYKKVDESNNEVTAYKLDDCNYGLLKRFFVSVLWRASVSSQEFYGQVNLGALEEGIRKDLNSQYVFKPDEFSVFLFILDDVDLKLQAKGVLVNPFWGRLSGVMSYEFNVCGIRWRIKASRKPLRDDILAYAQLQPEQPVRLFSKLFDVSEARKLYHKVALNSRQKIKG